MPMCTKSSNPERIPQGCLPKSGICFHTDQKPATASSFTVPDAADLIPEESFGQVLTAGSTCGWMLWLGVIFVRSGQLLAICKEHRLGTGKSTAKYQHPGHCQKSVSHFSNESRSWCSSKKQACEWGEMLRTITNDIFI